LRITTGNREPNRSRPAANGSSRAMFLPLDILSLTPHSQTNHFDKFLWSDDQIIITSDL